MAGAIKTSWHNNTISIALVKGDDIPAKIKESLATLVSKVQGKGQVALRLQKNLTLEVTSSEDIIRAVTDAFADMIAPGDMSLMLDMNVIVDIDPDAMTAAAFRTTMKDPDLKQILSPYEAAKALEEKP